MDKKSGNKCYIKTVQGNIEGKKAYLVFRKTKEHYYFNPIMEEITQPTGVSVIRHKIELPECNECKFEEKMKNVKKVFIDFYIPENEKLKNWVSFNPQIARICKYIFQNFDYKKSEFNLHMGNGHYFYDFEEPLNPNWDGEIISLNLMSHEESRSINA